MADGVGLVARNNHGPRAVGWAVWAVVLLAALIGCSPSGDERSSLLVFAATSLTDVLGDLEEAFEAGGQVDLAFSYGGSQTLAHQIASGAPADVFISAGAFPMRFLADRELVDSATTDIVTNQMVVAVRSSDGPRIESLDELGTSSVERIALADPDLAPAGRYSRESLTRLGLWEAVKSKVVFGPDVRATLAYVESGNADVALVYVTDARAGPDIQVLDIVPPDSYTPITYPAAIVTRSGHTAAANEFLAFLVGNEAEEIFRRHGFVTAE